MAIKVTQNLEKWLVEKGHCPAVAAGATEETRQNVFGQKTAELLADGTLTADKYSEITGDQKMSNSPSPEKMFANNGSQNIRVKNTSENYSEKRAVGLHVKTGREIYNPLTGGMAELPSERDNAKVGVLLKHLGQRSGLFSGVALSDHEKGLLDEMSSTDEWAGTVGGEHFDCLPGGGRIKALIDDATSGGLEVTPTFFDDQVVTFPLLTGELLPKVDLRDIPRGRRIESGSIGNPTISWGQGDNTEASLFTTDALVAALDSTVFGCAVAVEVGRDFLSDSGINVGRVLTANIGQRLAAELDKLIGSGNGTTQPEGILTGSGLTTINADNGAGGPPTVNDFLSLLFSIEKQYRNSTFAPCFVSNDTSYQRSRSIKIDASGSDTDQRPALSPLNNINTYSTLGWPHAIQNDIGNRSCVFGALRKFRLYRRLGMEVQWVNGGKELAQKNLVLLIVRARYAGRVMDANAFAKWTDGQS